MDSRPPEELSPVEVAEQLQLVTSWIEQQRVRERDARAAYELVRKDVEGRIATIRSRADSLVAAQARHLSSFSGLLGRNVLPEQPAPLADRGELASHTRLIDGGSKLSLPEAILAIWREDPVGTPLTTEEIAEALPSTGYLTDAKPTSLRSSINQMLARLVAENRIAKFRSDGSRITSEDTLSRARKYLPTSLLTDIDR